MLALQLRANGGFWVVGPIKAQHTLAHSIKVNIQPDIIVKCLLLKIYKTLYEILFYKNNFTVY